MRHVICHYHIYKNSGTTFDHMLAANFGDRHVAFDGPFPYFSISRRELLKVMVRNRNAVAFSSHQVALPVPASLDIKVLPVVFLRHPLLRIYSIYRFKRAQFDGTETSANAGSMDFSEWCRFSLGHPQEVTHLSNAQTRLVGTADGETVLQRRRPYGMEYDLAQAERNLSCVEMLARTEHFEADVSRFTAILARHGIDFDPGNMTPQNVEASDFEQTVEQRIESVEALLDGGTLDAVKAANRQDLALYGIAASLIEAA